MGGDIVPAMVTAGEAHVYDFSTNIVPGETERDHAYWRDVGTLDAYFDAHMDLVAPDSRVQPLQLRLADPFGRPVVPAGQGRGRPRAAGIGGQRHGV